MKKCLKCENTFPNRIIIEGKERFLNKRKFCLDCSPFGVHNTKSLNIEDNLLRICSVCQKEYQGGHQKSKNKCNSCRVTYYRNKTKQKAVEYKGGSCTFCGYDKCLNALQFHHIDPNKKEFSIGSYSFNKFDNLIDELDKCVLVCANCHAEIHAGLILIK
jgi:hypothetical protein